MKTNLFGKNCCKILSAVINCKSIFVGTRSKKTNRILKARAEDEKF